MPPPAVVAYDYEEIYGPNVWRTLSQEQWDALPWSQVVNITDDHDGAHDQYTVLAQWADTHEQPIRNVKIEQRQPNEWAEMR